MQSRLGQMETANTLISSARFKIANPDILAAQKAWNRPWPMLIRTQDNWRFHKSKTETVSGLNPQKRRISGIAFTVGHQAESPIFTNGVWATC